MKTKAILLLIILGCACKPSNKIGELVGVPKETPLEGTAWILSDWDTPIGDEVKRPTLTLLAENKRATGFSGCNTFGGTYKSSGKKLSFEGLISTRMFCEMAKEIEPKFLEVHHKTAGYSITEHELSLFDAENKLLARFRSEPKKQI